MLGVVTNVPTSVNTFVPTFRGRLRSVDLEDLAAKRFDALIEDLKRDHGLTTNGLFAQLNLEWLRSRLGTRNSRAQKVVKLDAFSALAERLKLDPTYFFTRPETVALDYHLYLRPGSEYGAYATSPSLQRFFATPVGRECTEAEREHLIDYDRAFGPVLTDRSAWAVLTAYRDVRTSETAQPPSAPQNDVESAPPDPPSPKPRKRAGKSGEYKAVQLPASVLHEPKVAYAKR